MSARVLFMNALPKLSYVLLSHNREKYIRGAIESAFAQDYEGELEYIFSDDCSTDKTFEIIKECVSEYKGNRRVVITQTPRNLHLAGNTNHAVQFITGDFVIRADDDDYSAVDRCSLIGKAIAENPGCSFVLTKQRRFTDAQDEEARKACSTPCSATPEVSIVDIEKGHDGLSAFFSKDCSHQVWSIRVYKEFGAIPLDGYYVDDVICFCRANVLGFGIAIQKNTVFVRDSSSNMCRGGDDGARGYNAIIRLEQFNDKYYNLTYQPLEQTIADIREHMQNSRPHAYATASNFFDALSKDMKERSLLCTYWRKGTLNRIKIKNKLRWKGLFNWLRCLPLPIYAGLLAIYRKLFK